MSSQVNLLCLAGSARSGSLNKKLALAAASEAEAMGVSATVCDLANYPMPLYDGDLEGKDGVPENAYKLKELFKAHHGIFVAAPEYNASITPLLKNALDWITRARQENEDPKQVFASRAFALGAASPGGTGGMRGLVMVRYTLEIGLGALVLPDQFLLPKAGSAFSDNNTLNEADAQQRLKSLLQKLAKTARLMQAEA